MHFYRPLYLLSVNFNYPSQGSDALTHMTFQLNNLVKVICNFSILFGERPSLSPYIRCPTWFYQRYFEREIFPEATGECGADFPNLL